MSLKMMAAEDNYEVYRIIAMKKLIRSIFSPIKDFCKTKNDFTAMFDDIFDESRKNKEEISEIMNCFQEFVTEEKVNGITYIRVNMNGQLNDKKCEGIFYQLERMEDSHKNSPQDVCMRRELKKLNLFKLRFKLEILAEIGISPQQKAEERISVNDLMMKAFKINTKCHKEAFDLI